MNQNITNEEGVASYVIQHGWDSSTESGFDSYDAAIARVKLVYGSDVVIGHPGDIPDGGERTLCWANELMAESSDGSRACCVIRKRHHLSEEGR